jgi:hypothetical protein
MSLTADLFMASSEKRSYLTHAIGSAIPLSQWNAVKSRACNESIESKERPSTTSKGRDENILKSPTPSPGGFSQLSF